MAKRRNKPKMHAGDIEIAIAYRYGWRRYLIVPNVYWGLGFRHEIDMLIVSPSGWATEVEIKVSISDLKADRRKSHNHESKRIRLLYFAVPEEIQEKALGLIPDRAGLFIVRREPEIEASGKTEIIKTPKINKGARRLSKDEITKLGRLGAMRIWSLKNVNYRLQRQKKDKHVYEIDDKRPNHQEA